MWLDLLNGKFKSPWQPPYFSYIMGCQKITDHALKTYAHMCDVKVFCSLILFSSYVHPLAKANGVFLFHGHVILFLIVNLQ